MAQAAVLREEGWLSRGELIDEIASMTHVHPETVRLRLARPLGDLESALFDRELMDQPDDWKVRYMFAPSVKYLLVAYNAHVYRGRRSARKLNKRLRVKFMQAFYKGTHASLVPERYQNDCLQALRKLGYCDNVTSITTARRRRRAG